MSSGTLFDEHLRSVGSPEVEAEIGRLFESRAVTVVSYGTQFAALWQVASDCVLGGKLLRPGLLLGAFDALREGGDSGVSRQSAVRIAAGVELLHYSFLLHDDVIDGDLCRRGQPNLIGSLLHSDGALTSWDTGTLRQAQGPALRQAQGPAVPVSQAVPEAPVDPRRLHWARACAVLVGDLLLSDVHQLFAREPLPEPIRHRLLGLLNHTIVESIVGEQLDVGLSDGVIPSDLGTVFEMSRLKTATYTFELPVQAAAILAGVQPPTRQAIGLIASQLGAAYQLQDDLFSTFGSAVDHGKDSFSDLREGKETALITYARRTDAWPRIAPLFGSPGLRLEDARVVRQLLTDCGAEGFLRTAIDDRLSAAAGLVGRHRGSLPAGLAQYLAELIELIGERRS